MLEAETDEGMGLLRKELYDRQADINGRLRQMALRITSLEAFRSDNKRIEGVRSEINTLRKSVGALERKNQKTHLKTTHVTDY